MARKGKEDIKKSLQMLKPWILPTMMLSNKEEVKRSPLYTCQLEWKTDTEEYCSMFWWTVHLNGREI